MCVFFFTDEYDVYVVVCVIVIGVASGCVCVGVDIVDFADRDVYVGMYCVCVC